MQIRFSLLSTLCLACTLLVFSSCEDELLTPDAQFELDEAKLAVTDAPSAQELVDIDYDVANDYYVVNLRDRDGRVYTYYGNQKTYTMQREDRDVNSAKGDFLAQAIANDGTYQVVSLFQGAINTNGGYTFSGAPRTNSGGAKVGDLVEFIDIDYDSANEYYVISGRDASGAVRAYYGKTRNWTEVREDRNFEVAMGDYLAAAFDGAGNHLVISTFQGKVVANRGYTFSGAPRTNSGGANVGDLVEFLNVDYDSANDYYLVTGRNAAGEIISYYGNQRDWTQVNDKRDVTQAWGDYQATAYANDGTFTTATILQNKVSVQKGYTFYNAPRQNSGKYFLRK